MKEIRKDLKSLSKEEVARIRTLREKCYCGGNNKLFFDELEAILKSEEYVENDEWEKSEKNDLVIGDVWQQPIGDIRYKNTIHRYTYLWTDSLNVVINYHNYRELSEDGKYVKKGRAWYIFSNGDMDFCRRNGRHRLFNETGEPMYVILLEIFNTHSSRR